MTKRIAWLWLIFVLALLAHNAWMWGSGKASVDTDIQALLPADERNPLAAHALERMASNSAQQVVVLIGSDDWETSKRAASAFTRSLSGSLITLDSTSVNQADDWQQFYHQHRLALLTEGGRVTLQREPPGYWFERSASLLYSPMRSGLGWRDDPFGLFGDWMMTRALQTPVRPVDGHLVIERDGRRYLVLPMTLHGQVFSTQLQASVMPVLQHARAAAQNAAPQAHILLAGVLLHAAAAADTAQQEMSTIGLGGTMGILLIMLLVFRKLKPLMFAMLSMGIGLLGALSVCFLVYERVHMLTLVFGASLVGVAVDYSIHLLCEGFDCPDTPQQRVRKHLRGLFLAMFTSVIAYAGLALTPFPGLQQMALFAAAGLVVAWLSVVCWYPWFAAPVEQCSSFATRAGATRRFWPTVGNNRISWLFVLVAVVILVTGAQQLHVEDDIRLLHNPSPALMAEQQQVGKLLGLPSPAQFFIVHANTTEELLRQEEILTQQLDALTSKGIIQGYQAISSWVPSQQTQRDNIQLQQEKLYTATHLSEKLSALTGESITPASLTNNTTQKPFTLEQWLASPVSRSMQSLWLGRINNQHASLVTLAGVTPAALGSLAALGSRQIEWVDRPGQISTLLERHRHLMSLVIAISYLLIFAVLIQQYRRTAWRVIMPTLLSSVLTLAMLALLDQPIQIFTVLALFLVLGIGVDYGIFLLEHAAPEMGNAWLSVSLSAISTILSFGLLALSTTPALKTFGLTVLFGIGWSWALTPYFCNKVASARPSSQESVGRSR